MVLPPPAVPARHSRIVKPRKSTTKGPVYKDPRVRQEYGRDFTGYMVNVLVGEDAEVIEVYEKILRSSSAFFAAALKKEWREGRQKEVELPEATKPLFNQYIGYLYSGSIAVGGDSVAEMYKNLSGLYALGERLLDDSFKDTVISSFKATTEESKGILAAGVLPGWPVVNQIYGTTTEGSPVRRLMVDIHVMHGKSNLTSLSTYYTLDQEFLLDLTKALLDERQLSGDKKEVLKDKTSQSSCAHHHHKESEPCPVKRRKLNDEL